MGQPGYAPDQYSNNQHTPDQFPQYPASQYPGSEYQGNQYGADQFGAGANPNHGGQYPGTQFPGNQYVAGQPQAGQYGADQYAGNQYAANQYAGNQYAANQYGATQYAVPVQTMPGQAGGANKSRSRLAFGGVAVVAVLALVVVGLTAIRGRAPSGGASSPTDAVTEFVNAANALDPVSMMLFVAPSETAGWTQLYDAVTPKVNDATSIAKSWNEWSGSTGGDGALSKWTDHGTPSVQVTSSSAIEQLDTVARVEFKVESHYNPTAATEADAAEFEDYDKAMREMTEVLNATTFQFITVKENDKWYVSAFMSAQNPQVVNIDSAQLSPDLIEEADNLNASSQSRPPIDLAAVDNIPPATAQTPDEALENIITAFATSDPALLMASVDSSVARQIAIGGDQVFTDVVSPAAEEVSTERSVTWELSEPVDDVYRVNRLEGEVTFADETVNIAIEGWCARFESDGSGDSACLTDYVDWLSNIDGLPLVIRQERGGYVLSPAGSVLTLTADIVSLAPTADWMRQIDVAQYDTSTHINVGEPTTLDFGGKPYIVVDFDWPDTAQRYSIDLSEASDPQLEQSEVKMWALVGTDLKRQYLLDSSDVTTKGRAVIYSPNTNYDCVALCDAPTEGSVTVTLNLAN